jgi:hypothetical protein
VGAKPGANVLHFLTGGSVIFLIMFNEYLQVQAVANLITEIDICLHCFLWMSSRVPRHGCQHFAFSHRGSVIFLIMFNEYLQVQAVAYLITEVGICLCCFLWVPSQVPRHGVRLELCFE